MTLSERFEDKIFYSPDGCHYWIGTSTPKKYGSVVHNKTVMRVHRLAYILKHGEIPEELYVCHTCDNRLCVNTDHLFLGTQNDNMQDMVRKGRHYKALLGTVEVTAIRDTYSMGHRIVDIAKYFKMKANTIQKIVSGKNYKSFNYTLYEHTV